MAKKKMVEKKVQHSYQQVGVRGSGKPKEPGAVGGQSLKPPFGIVKKKGK